MNLSQVQEEVGSSKVWALWAAQSALRKRDTVGTGQADNPLGWVWPESPEEWLDQVREMHKAEWTEASSVGFTI